MRFLLKKQTAPDLKPQINFSCATFVPVTSIEAESRIHVTGTQVLWLRPFLKELIKSCLINMNFKYYLIRFVRRMAS